MDKIFVTIWKDGSWKVWRELDAYYSANDPDWLVNIPLDIIELDAKKEQ